MTKPVKLRAFKFDNPDIKHYHSDAQQKLADKLQNTLIKDRGMLINEGDPLEETDYIAHFHTTPSGVLIGAVVRTTIAENTPNMTDDMLNKQNIVIADLQMVNGKNLLVKYLYYFAISEDYLVTNLRRSQKITSFQTYLNWLLQKEVENEPYCILPVIRKQEISYDKVKGINFQAPRPKKELPEQKNTIIKKFQNIKKQLLSSELFNDVKDIDDIINNDAVIVDILLKFTKCPDTKEDYETQIGNIINNIVDTSSVSLNTKNGLVKLGDVEFVETFDIETTKTGLLSEQQLYGQMEHVINTLKKQK